MGNAKIRELNQQLVEARRDNDKSKLEVTRLAKQEEIQRLQRAADQIAFDKEQRRLLQQLSDEREGYEKDLAALNEQIEAARTQEHSKALQQQQHYLRCLMRSNAELQASLAREARLKKNIE